MSGTSRKRQAAGSSDEVGGEAFVVRALAKGLAMIGLFDAVHREWTLDEMVAELNLPRMTGYRMARTLQGAGYLVVDRHNGRYRLGPAMLAAAYLAEAFTDLVAVARPYLEALARETGESASLAVYVDGAAVCVDAVDSLRPHKRDLAVGRVIEDTSSAHGKVHAAFLTGAEHERSESTDPGRSTPHEIAGQDGLLEELERVRAQGVALDVEEHRLGTCTAAAPVLDQTADVVGSLAVIVPAGRFGPDERETCVHAVKAQAAALSAFLGYAGGASRP